MENVIQIETNLVRILCYFVKIIVCLNMSFYLRNKKMFLIKTWLHVFSFVHIG